MIFRTFFGFLFSVISADCGASFLATESRFDGFSAKNKVYSIDERKMSVVDDGDESQEMPPRLRDFEEIEHKDSERYYTYELKDGDNKVVYISLAANLDKKRRENAVRSTRLVVVGGPKTKKEAFELKEMLLENYRRSHEGRNPLYNQESVK